VKVKQLELFETGRTFENRSVRAVTFLGKMDLPVHRWYRLTPSFSPSLADDIADHYDLNERDFVLDPFSGVGTVPLCMKFRGIPACSVEINPYLHFVGVVKTRTYADVEGIEKTFQRFQCCYRQHLDKSNAVSNASRYLQQHEEYIPTISKPERWWSPGNLAQLVVLRRLLTDYDCSPEHHDLLKMAILSILVPVSNARHNHVSLTFADRPLETVDVANVLREKHRHMIDDLHEAAHFPAADVTVYSGNSKELASVLPKRPKVSVVITSPPYPNRFSYARETRPHMFFFKFIESARAVGELETAAIGGTWGKATSVLSKGIDPMNEVVAKLLAPYTGDIRNDGELMASYVTKYFNDIYVHAEQISHVTRKKARLAYVIGNSKFYENPLPSDEILAGIFAHFGFDLDRIDRMRRRQSKKGLYESVVFMERR